jgi:hypothetical protein
MGKGSPMLGVRISKDLLDEVNRTILRRNTWTFEEPWTMARFISIAIREKLAKMDRSRLRRKAIKPSGADRGETDV